MNKVPPYTDDDIGQFGDTMIDDALSAFNPRIWKRSHDPIDKTGVNSSEFLKLRNKNAVIYFPRLLANDPLESNEDISIALLYLLRKVSDCQVMMGHGGSFLNLMMNVYGLKFI